MIQLFNAETSDMGESFKGTVYQLSTTNPMDGVFAIKPERMSFEDFEDECKLAFRIKYRNSARLASIELADWLFE